MSDIPTAIPQILTWRAYRPVHVGLRRHPLQDLGSLVLTKAVLNSENLVTYPGNRTIHHVKYTHKSIKLASLSNRDVLTGLSELL